MNLVTKYYKKKHLLVSCVQALADAMTGISAHAKQGELQGFCDCVGNFANSVCGIIENSAHVSDCACCYEVSVLIKNRVSDLTLRQFIDEIMLRYNFIG